METFNGDGTAAARGVELPLCCRGVMSPEARGISRGVMLPLLPRGVELPVLRADMRGVISPLARADGLALAAVAMWVFTADEATAGNRDAELEFLSSDVISIARGKRDADPECFSSVSAARGAAGWGSRDAELECLSSDFGCSGVLGRPLAGVLAGTTGLEADSGGLIWTIK